jgi:2Fe-2S ferredoxin
MAQIRFQKPRPAVDAPSGSNLMKALLAGGVPVASSCNGDGICAKCRIQIIAGKENLSPENDREKFLREKFQIPRGERVSCQTEILGDVTVNTTYW